MATATTEHYRTYTPRPFTRAERDSVTVLFGGLHETIAHYLEKYAGDIIARKKAAMAPGCPLKNTSVVY
jgi:hypothetical protein